jgi:hypothetical protein
MEVFISDEAFLNLAKPIKAVAHVGFNAGLGLFRVSVAS